MVLWFVASELTFFLGSYDIWCWVVAEESGEAEKTRQVRLTQQMILCLTLYDAGLLPKVVIQTSTTPRPTQVYYIVIVGNVRGSGPNQRVRRDALVTRYHHIVDELNSFVPYVQNHSSTPVAKQVKSIRSVLAELQNLFPEEPTPPEYVDDVEGLMERQHLQTGLATCSLIDNKTLSAIVDNIERKLGRTSYPPIHFRNV